MGTHAGLVLQTQCVANDDADELSVLAKDAKVLIRRYLLPLRPVLIRILPDLGHSSLRYLLPARLLQLRQGLGDLDVVETAAVVLGVEWLGQLGRQADAVARLVLVWEGRRRAEERGHGARLWQLVRV